ncbi:UNVERIFIED_CONTAM: hypothetical protein PYX00_005081 [Menopon gallinae]|uniref:Lysosomal-associated transmembrane protein 4A n=1 Tax=Menopon gallinae TaxID=328185 RepID=A0AAW2HPU8_9NEOP
MNVLRSVYQKSKLYYKKKREVLQEFMVVSEVGRIVNFRIDCCNTNLSLFPYTYTRYKELVMQGLRLKFGDRRTDWKCCFCCHVRTGTIFIGIWYLMLHALILSIMAVVLSYPKILDQDIDPVLPTPLSEVDQVSPEVYTGNFDWSHNSDGSSIKPLPLLPHGYRELWERQNFSHQDMNIGVVVTICSFTMTLMLLYGAIKGKPSYLMPFFCLKVFDFCVAGISAVGYLCYPPDMNQYWMKKFKLLPFKEELSDFHPDTIVIFAATAFVLIMLIKAYFISIIWRCYKYLSFRQIAAQRTVHFIDPVVQNLLPDLPDYETAVKKFPTPPPSYASAVRGQAPIVVNMNNNRANSSQPLSAQSIVVRSNTPVGTAPIQGHSSSQVNNPEII